MSTRILLLGGRAPTALEWARHLNEKGCVVHAAESLKTYICQASRAITKFHHIAPPAQQEENFIHDLIEIIKRENIHRLIPTCEEAFYVAKHKERLSQYADVFTSDHQLMQRLHNKYSFIEEMGKYNILAPKSALFDFPLSPHKRGGRLSIKIDPHLNRNEQIYKPVYSRFASKVFVHRDKCKFPKFFKPSKQTPWIAQEFIEGRSICTFSIVQEGKIQFHVAYEPKYQLKRGAGMYLQRVKLPHLDEQIQSYLNAVNYTGQIGFDFIVRGADFYAIEANPRCTSGMHFINSGRKKMVGLPLFIQSVSLMLQGTNPIKFCMDLLKAKDVIWSKSDWRPFFYQITCLLSLLKNAAINRSRLLEMTTLDIEYNGES